jgi:GTPase SAR1 family protein
MYTNNVEVIFLMYAIDNENSFQSLDKFINCKAIQDSLKKSYIYLVGTKSDLKNNRCVKQSDVLDWCKNVGISEYFEISSKNNVNIHNLFHYVIFNDKHLKNILDLNTFPDLKFKNDLFENNLYFDCEFIFEN